jgi:hypothetical protein
MQPIGLGQDCGQIAHFPSSEYNHFSGLQTAAPMNGRKVYKMVYNSVNRESLQNDRDAKY